MSSPQLPLYFQFSPEPQEVVDRYTIPLHVSMKDCFEPNHGFWRGGSLPELEAELARTVSRWQKDFRDKKFDSSKPIVIAACCHGLSTDSFRGYPLSKLWGMAPQYLLWSPNSLWNGRNSFSGLKKHLQPLIKDDFKIIVVFAQCFGGTFAQKFRSDLGAELPANVHVIGLSQGPTHRLRANDCTLVTVAHQCQHIELSTWFTHFAEQEGSAFERADASLLLTNTQATGLPDFVPVNLIQEEDKDMTLAQESAIQPVQ
ncbi:hypothetical protein PTSG_11943 [Salpingoeca rosetta]|uniref:Uncharacterized protein n=1 Tax=Salpingoeca rosetta (strain ATCC 50818 / BSB-021) TaxID=946362 RepID=F2U3T9_SALR5|nr:uncharacterized protein PTSG_11943 [Salpingoeca rosetta]EGD82283.1 hypothetical protein PTSG_11943 [Salpingoeca rosetta]|eukprot:XP_004996466.1 hypothetical protein PTSG_11943 [Salpingoeca rosetta]